MCDMKAKDVESIRMMKENGKRHILFFILWYDSHNDIDCRHDSLEQIVPLTT